MDAYYYSIIYSVISFSLSFFIFLVYPSLYLSMHPWVKYIPPSYIYDSNLLFNYFPLVSSLKQKMNSFYRYWLFVSFVWGLLFGEFVFLFFIIPRNTILYLIVPFIFVIPSGIFFLLRSARYIFRKYRECFSDDF